jgi:hypothetical protein
MRQVIPTESRQQVYIRLLIVDLLGLVQVLIASATGCSVDNGRLTMGVFGPETHLVGSLVQSTGTEPLCTTFFPLEPLTIHLYITLYYPSINVNPLSQFRRLTISKGYPSP